MIESIKYKKDKVLVLGFEIFAESRFFRRFMETLNFYSESESNQVFFFNFIIERNISGFKITDQYDQKSLHIFEDFFKKTPKNFETVGSVRRRWK